MQQDVADTQEIIEALERIRRMPDAEQVSAMRKLTETLTDLRQAVMVEAFTILLGLDYTERVKAFGFFIAGMREGMK